MWLCEIHRRLVYRWWCHEGAYCTWDMTWSHVTKVAKIKMRLGSMDRLQVWRASRRLWSDGPWDGEAWARLGDDGSTQQWRASEVKIDGPRSYDDLKWIISFVIWLVHCCINVGGDGVECARQRYNLGHFHFIGHRCVEKLMTRFRIDGHTIKRGKLVCILVI
jgi:hypothetical protein